MNVPFLCGFFHALGIIGWCNFLSHIVLKYGRKFSIIYQLENHERIHTRDKPFEPFEGTYCLRISRLDFFPHLVRQKRSKEKIIAHIAPEFLDLTFFLIWFDRKTFEEKNHSPYCHRISRLDFFPQVVWQRKIQRKNHSPYCPWISRLFLWFKKGFVLF